MDVLEDLDDFSKLTHGPGEVDDFILRFCGWGAEVSSIVSEELFWKLDGPIVRVTTPHIPLAAADALEDAMMPSAEKIIEATLKLVD